MLIIEAGVLLAAQTWRFELLVGANFHGGQAVNGRDNALVPLELPSHQVEHEVLVFVPMILFVFAPHICLGCVVVDQVVFDQLCSFIGLFALSDHLSNLISLKGSIDLEHLRHLIAIFFSIQTLICHIILAHAI